MKTIRNWLDQLKEPERTEALSNMKPSGTIEKEDFQSEALRTAFAWDCTTQGFEYWSEIQRAIRSGTYYDAPQHTPEEFDTKAKTTIQKAAQEAHKPSEDVLEEALRITGGDRMADYGPPDQDFKRTAVMWEQLLTARS
jgi:hypothetical protein